MNILLDNPLATMYGPYFLVAYGFFIFFVLIGLSIMKNLSDQTTKLNTPPIPSTIDPYEIAFLRGGTNEVARSVIFSLMQKDFVEIINDRINPKIKQVSKSLNKSGLNQIELLALEWIGKERDSKEVFQPNGLVKQLESYGLAYQTRLERAQLLVSDHTKNKFSQWKWFAMLSILSLGFYKIIAAIAHGRYNFIFILIICVIGLVITHFVSKMPRLTNLGKSYLERLQYTFNTLKNQTKQAYKPSETPKSAPQTVFGGIDPLLLSVGVFGGAILAGTAFDNYNQTFQKAEKEQSAYSNGSCSAGCGSGCSSGWSGGSSCSSGSSCGSGSSCSSGCGGGCGGCGS